MLIALLSVTPPHIALPVHAMIQLGSNAGRAYLLREHIMGGIVRWIIPGSIAGIVIASLVFVKLPIQTLQWMLALFVLWTVWAPKGKVREVPEIAYLGIGALTSFANLFLGATGPLLAIFLSPARYGRDKTVATHAASMLLQHLFKVIAFGFLGFAMLRWIPFLGAMIICGFAGTAIGGVLLKRIPEERFKLLFKVVLTALAIRLLYRAVFDGASWF